MFTPIQDAFQDIKKTGSVGLFLPATNRDIERGFKLHNLLKTGLRNWTIIIEAEGAPLRVSISKGLEPSAGVVARTGRGCYLLF